MRFLAYFRSPIFNNIIRGMYTKHRRLVYVAPTVLGGLIGGLLINNINSTSGKKYLPLMPVMTAYTESNDDTKKNKKSFMYNYIADAVEKVAPSVVYIEVNLGRGRGLISSTGSGVVATEDGIVLTNGHVVNSVSIHDYVDVKFASGKQYKGYVIGVDHKSDLAAIKLKTDDKFPAAIFGKSSDVRVGEWVAALGSPLRLSNTVTCGIVSTLHRSGGELKMRKDMEYIQTDAAINIGNSGGPLINLDGEVIGINCMTVEGASGISFAVPSDVVSDFLKKAINKLNSFSKTDTAIKKPPNEDKNYFIGVSMLTLTPSILQQFQFKDPEMYGTVQGGVWVGRVSPTSPAGRSGLYPGDVIVSVNGEAANASSDVFEKVKKGEMLELEVQRGRSIRIIRVTPEVIQPHH